MSISILVPIKMITRIVIKLAEIRCLCFMLVNNLQAYHPVDDLLNETLAHRRTGGRSNSKALDRKAAQSTLDWRRITTNAHIINWNPNPAEEIQYTYIFTNPQHIRQIIRICVENWYLKHICLSELVVEKS